MVDTATAANAMSGILPRDSEITIQDAVKKALGCVAAQFPTYKEDQPRAGAHRTFAAQVFASTLATSDSYSGVGIPFMWLDFQCFSPLGYVPSLGDVATRLAEGAPTPITPKTRIAILDYVLDKTTAPAPGELKRLDHDVEVTATVKLARISAAENTFRVSRRSSNKMAENQFKKVSKPQRRREWNKSADAFVQKMRETGRCPENTVFGEWCCEPRCCTWSDTATESHDDQAEGTR